MSTRAKGTVRYVDAQRWSLRYPKSLSLERSTSGPGMVTFTEVTVANFHERRGVVTGRTRNGGFVRFVPPLDRAGRFPRGGVAFRMLAIDGGPLPAFAVADSRFPISTATFHRPQQRDFPAADYNRLGLPLERTRPIDADDEHYIGELFAGRSATPSARAAIKGVVRSLVFPRLRAGEAVGGERILGLARSYPVGSFTLIRAGNGVCEGSSITCGDRTAPFYLVHASGRLEEPELIAPCTSVVSACASPGAFYAIGWRWQTQAGAHTSTCDLRLDRHDDDFYCTNSTARWDRVGRVIRRPTGVRVGEPLEFAFAKRTWDGHIVLIPGDDRTPPDDTAVKLLWPAIPRR
jgi:hypothetical protein